MSKEQAMSFIKANGEWVRWGLYIVFLGSLFLFDGRYQTKKEAAQIADSFLTKHAYTQDLATMREMRSMETKILEEKLKALENTDSHLKSYGLENRGLIEMHHREVMTELRVQTKSLSEVQGVLKASGK